MSSSHLVLGDKTREIMTFQPFSFLWPFQPFDNGLSITHSSSEVGIKPMCDVGRLEPCFMSVTAGGLLAYVGLCPVTGRAWPCVNGE